eukprot:CAMPEP_0185789088 /NCGR_PEP_ID=MMETSP1174-20130828/149231_1 /TAXON_ID=35687 /ORGANISM="Dictyocha speculum, Strain CCMP1381" /LENGTH=34 /DNA_ID= /DNA_START= /DNA_END= /DNA_ORIENTATION=
MTLNAPFSGTEDEIAVQLAEATATALVELVANLG